MPDFRLQSSTCSEGAQTVCAKVIGFVRWDQDAMLFIVCAGAVIDAGLPVVIQERQGDIKKEYAEHTEFEYAKCRETPKKTRKTEP
jgi:hypothetical protein